MKGQSQLDNMFGIQKMSKVSSPNAEFGIMNLCLADT